MLIKDIIVILNSRIKLSDKEKNIKLISIDKNIADITFFSFAWKGIDCSILSEAMTEKTAQIENIKLKLPKDSTSYIFDI